MREERAQLEQQLLAESHNHDVIVRRLKQKIASLESQVRGSLSTNQPSSQSPSSEPTQSSSGSNARLPSNSNTHSEMHGVGVDVMQQHVAEHAADAVTNMANDDVLGLANAPIYSRHRADSNNQRVRFQIPETNK